MCTKCKDDRCSGMYLLHSAELKDRYKIVRKELLENKNKKFILIKSTSSGEIFTKFYELHVIDNVSNDEAGLFENRVNTRVITTDVKSLVNLNDAQIDIVSLDIGKIPKQLDGVV